MRLSFSKHLTLSIITLIILQIAYSQPNQVATSSIIAFKQRLSPCKLNQIKTPSGCIKSCQSPQYKNCPDFFPAIFNPRFCGFTKEGKWVDFTFQCQACKSSNIVGVLTRKCSCQQKGCGKCQICQAGVCITNKKLINQCLVCKDFQIKQNGKCVDKCTIMKCLSGKCSKGQCVAVDPCVQKKISCRPGTKCQKGQCIPLPNPCKSMCQKWQLCLNGKCQDKCSIIRCANCFKGQCGVTDKCLFIKCTPTTQCVNGECISINPCRNVVCPTNWKCNQGKCQSQNQNQNQIPLLNQSQFETSVANIKKFDPSQILNNKIDPFISTQLVIHNSNNIVSLIPPIPKRDQIKQVKSLKDTNGNGFKVIGVSNPLDSLCDIDSCKFDETCFNGKCIKNNFGFNQQMSQIDRLNK